MRNCADSWHPVLVNMCRAAAHIRSHGSATNLSVSLIILFGNAIFDKEAYATPRVDLTTCFRLSGKNETGGGKKTCWEECNLKLLAKAKARNMVQVDRENFVDLPL